MSLFVYSCPKCGKQNDASSVSTGSCSHCGYVAVETDVDDGSVFKISQNSD